MQNNYLENKAVIIDFNISLCMLYMTKGFS